MDKIFQEVLTAVGDTVFSDAVRAQRPEIQSAVRRFVGPDKDRSLKDYSENRCAVA